MNLQALLWRCTQDALAALGEPTMQSIVWRMNKVGVSVTPEGFDIRKFAEVLNRMMGDGADIILDLVARNLTSELGLTRAPSGLSGLDNVLKVLEMAKEMERR